MDTIYNHLFELDQNYSLLRFDEHRAIRTLLRHLNEKDVGRLQMTTDKPSDALILAGGWWLVGFNEHQILRNLYFKLKKNNR
jgi:hypothetical protein